MAGAASTSPNFRSRLLPPAEWPRLNGTELQDVWPHLKPEAARVLVVEDAEGVIVGCWALLTVVHVEGVWVHPKHRGKAGVARRLVVGMKREARDMGAAAVLTAALSDEVVELIEALGGEPLPGEHYVIPIGAGKCQSA